MAKNFLIVCLILVSVSSASTALGENPTSASISFTTTPSTGPIKIGKLVRFRVEHRFLSAVETGGSCTVDLLACLSEFAPKGEDPASSSCTLTTIGSKTVSQGESEVVFVTRAKPVRAKSDGGGRQLNFQTSSDCIDGSANQDTILSSPRARKVSDPSQRGIPTYKFIQSLVERLS